MKVKEDIKNGYGKGGRVIIVEEETRDDSKGWEDEEE